MEHPLPYDPSEVKWQHPAAYAKCFFLERAFIDLKFRTLVIRGFPFLPRSTVHIPSGFNERQRSPSKIIGIVPTETEVISEFDEYYAGLGGPRICCEGTCSGGLATEATAPNATMWGGAPFHAAPFITIVFWTESPTVEWVPPCLHSHPTTDYDPDDYPELMGGPRCCYFAEWMVRDLAKGLSRHCTAGEEPMSITIVNAAAFMPPDYWSRETYPERLQSGQATHAEAEEHFMKAVKWEQIRENRPLEIKFLTMQEWIATGEWEDALSEKEMRPWLDASR